MNELYIGIGLMILGILLFIFSFFSKRPSVSADHGSTAIGGANSGFVINNNQNQPKETEKHSGGHTLTVIAIIVELVGIGVTIWHAMHLAAK